MKRGLDAIVIGAGVSGLTTAIRMQEAGWNVRILAAAPPEKSTSNIAAAIWFPTSVGPRAQVLQWGSRTYDVLTSLAADAASGVLMRECLILARDPPATPWWADAVGGVTVAAEELLPRGYNYGLRWTAPLAEMPLYLPWLLRRFVTAGGHFELRHIPVLARFIPDSAVIVNCSGLGARQLVPDSSVVPVRGQLAIVTNPGIDISIRDDEHPNGRAYIHPRRSDCVLGGTDDVGTWDQTVDPAVGESIIRRCIDLAPSLANAHLIRYAVGLRPARPTVRLEIDRSLYANRILVHNYGHGGAGITLSWGCADEVVKIVQAA